MTEAGKYSRDYYYLDTMRGFMKDSSIKNTWGGVVFSDKYPSTNRELYESVALLID